MKFDMIGVDRLIPYVNNARTHSKEQIKKIQASIREFGFCNPILVDDKLNVIAGHGRLEAAKAEKMEHVPCVFLSHLSPTQAKAYVLADNRLALDAGWDEDLLSLELKELEQNDFDLESIGFDSDELDKLLEGLNEPIEGQTDADEVPEVEENIHNVKLGDIWQLGNHRLMCGDSTDKATVEKLMNGEKADMVFTDPPYGIGIEKKQNEITKQEFLDDGRKLKRNKYKQVDWDGEPFDPSLVLKFFEKTKEIFLWGANCYGHLLPDGSKHGWVCWDKRTSENRVSGSDFEIAWSKQVRTKLIKYPWFGPFGFQKKIDGDRRVHPTQKPVAMILDCFERWGKDKTKIVDLFLGSGSTLIACEKTNRKCYGMEIDPHYCSVIIERWQNYTGKNAVKET